MAWKYVQWWGII